jgi:hypothetical protein
MKGFSDAMNDLQSRYVMPVLDRLVATNSAVAHDLGDLIEGATSLPIDVVCAIEERLPVWLFFSKDRFVDAQKNAFTLGRDVGRMEVGAPPVGYGASADASRHLHTVR